MILAKEGPLHLPQTLYPQHLLHTSIRRTIVFFHRHTHDLGQGRSPPPPTLTYHSPLSPTDPLPTTLFYTPSYAGPSYSSTDSLTYSWSWPRKAPSTSHPYISQSPLPYRPSTHNTYSTHLHKRDHRILPPTPWHTHALAQGRNIPSLMYTVCEWAQHSTDTSSLRNDLLLQYHQLKNKYRRICLDISEPDRFVWGFGGTVVSTCACHVTVVPFL
jgi:hypothetical protein